MTRILAVACAGLVVMVLLAGCAGGFTGGSAEPTSTATTTAASADPASWRDMALTDPVTGKQFKLSDFAGKPLLLHTFASWCETCEEQQAILQKLQTDRPDLVIVAVGVDPDENEGAVKAIWEERGLTLPVTVASTAFREGMEEELGPFSILVERAPIAYIPPDQTAPRMLANGVKTAEEIEDEISAE